MSGFESQPCGRCGGSGRHSYCTAYGDTCFKCGGKGKLLTKRGAAASNYLNSLRSVDADQISVGDVVLTYIGWTSVMEVSVNGEDVDYTTILINRDGTKRTNNAWATTLNKCPRNKKIRLRFTGERAVETMRLALEFQASLTKSGKPKKEQKP
jgi:hypothetical protein